ncbi:MAG TPA: O-antigen ligase family protein [Candidatus Saccharimonadales bacterium]|nr:O-antigen ligase family protein [Candidatus Saccharimonadales bacterium]
MIQTPLHKKLFYLLIFLLPINLGKHFIFNWAYVGGLLIDYLLPTIYFIDILVFVILVLWIADLIKNKKELKYLTRLAVFQFLAFYVFCVFLSVLSAERIGPAIYLFIRFFLYFSFSIYVFNNIDLSKDFPNIITLCSLSVGLLSILALLQWVRQGAVFNNYLFFGEQPYTSATAQIATKSFFGIGKVPPYATFRHPNAFAGYLSILLLWISTKKAWLARLLLVLGLIALFFTLSKTAWIATLLGFLFIYLIQKNKRIGYTTTFLVTGLAIAGGILLVFIPNKDFLSYNPSLFRRVNFIMSTTESIRQKTLFGIGLNNNTVVIEKYLPPAHDIRFVQPVHNIFLLVASESGVLALLFFTLFIFSIVWLLIKRNNFLATLLVVSICQLLILGSFDHYVFTLQQNYLLFWLVIGLSLTYSHKQ